MSKTVLYLDFGQQYWPIFSGARALTRAMIYWDEDPEPGVPIKSCTTFAAALRVLSEPSVTHIRVGWDASLGVKYLGDDYAIREKVYALMRPHWTRLNTLNSTGLRVSQEAAAIIEVYGKELAAFAQF